MTPKLNVGDIFEAINVNYYYEVMAVEMYKYVLRVYEKDTHKVYGPDINYEIWYIDKDPVKLLPDKMAAKQFDNELEELLK